MNISYLSILNVYVAARVSFVLRYLQIAHVSSQHRERKSALSCFRGVSDTKSVTPDAQVFNNGVRVFVK